MTEPTGVNLGDNHWNVSVKCGGSVKVRLTTRSVQTKCSTRGMDVVIEKPRTISSEEFASEADFLPELDEPINVHLILPADGPGPVFVLDLNHDDVSAL